MGHIKFVDLLKFVGAGHNLVCCLVIPASTGVFGLLQDFSGIFSQPKGLRVSQYVVFVEPSSLTQHRP